MKMISYNVVAICLIALAAFMIYLNREGWGWCVLGAVAVTVIPSGVTVEDEDN